MVPEQAVFGVCCFGKQRKVADDDYLFSSAFCRVKFLFQPYFLPNAHCAAVVVFFRPGEEVFKGLALFSCFGLVMY